MRNTIAPAHSVLSVLQLALLSGSVVAAEGSRPQLVFSDTFSEASSDWETTGGEWRVAGGKYGATYDGSGNAIAYPRLAPFLGVQTIRATVAVQRRGVSSGWSFAGITVFQDESNLWLLAFTEGPQGQRYVDFLESYRGEWQTQNSGPTRLDFTVGKDLRTQWSYDTEYELRLDLAGQGIAATVRTRADGAVVGSARYGFGKAKAVRMGIGGLIVRGCQASFSNVSVVAPKMRESTADMKIETGRLGNVAILDDNLPDLDRSVAAHLAAALRKAGFGVTCISAETACNPAVLSPWHFSLYVIPNATVYPGDGYQALTQYLRRRGHLMVLGGPAFTRTVWQYGDRWVDRGSIRALLAKQRAERVFLSFDDTDDLSAWSWATNATDVPSKIEVVEGAPTGKCMRMSMEGLTSWCTYSSPTIEGMFPEGHELLCFWARGDAQTSQLSVEINETDGSRWIAVAPLTTQWQHCVLAPGDFAYWPDSRTKKTRGGSGDRLNPQAANRIVLGLAFSHTKKVGRGPHTLWVDQFGTAANPFADFMAGPANALQPIETITPTYKVYSINDATKLRVARSQTFVDTDLKLPVTQSPVSSIARPTGQGFGNRSKWRWIPLVEAIDDRGERRGTVAWMIHNHSFPFTGSTITAIGVNDQAQFKDPVWTTVVTQAVRRIKQGVFIREAGARHFSYWPSEPVELGAEVVNLGDEQASLTAKIAVKTHDGTQTAIEEQTQIDVAPHRSMTLKWKWRAPRTGPETYTVTTELLADGRIVDVVSHELGILSDRRPARDEFVTVKGSDFYLNGHKWYPVGVNFWPLYVAGQESADYGLGWLTNGFYLPDEVELDLARMAALGMNTVVIQMGRQDSIRNLLDFLRRCEKHQIKVFGFLHCLSPLAFDEDAARRFIEEARLADNAAFFAYDTIWEPGNWVFRKDKRNAWDRDWEKWIIERYGSLANAEADWGLPAPRADGKVASPADHQMKRDGEWRVMVAAYRRFMDDLTSRKWNAAHRKLRKIDPNHLVSFRQGNTLPQDFTFTATPKHIDFICPEGYAIHLGEDGYNAAGFITRYVNFTTRGKPILWAEFGKSVWDRERMTQDAASLKVQHEYHEMFYRMVVEAGANGTAPWWWPGGYRVNERSDYGICSPDGTPRPSALLLDQYGPRMKTPRDYPKPDTWLSIDRDAHPGGYWHITFNQGKDAYRQARSQGKNLGLRTAGTGTSSANCPLIAVGNRPYSGKNPPKYLNAEFNWLQIRNAKGQWVEVVDRVEVTKDSPVRARASLGNLQEAEWLAPDAVGDGPGAVCLASAEGSQVAVKIPIPQNTPYLADVDFGEFILAEGVTKAAHVVLQMTAEGRAWFGEKRSVWLDPTQ